MVSRILFISSLIAFCLASVSCTLGHRETTLEVPLGSRPGGKGKVTLTSVKDSRLFQNHPAQPSTPSISGDVNTLSAARRDHFIGRQHTGFGTPAGDVGLSGGGTMTAKVRELVTEALARRGYQPGAGGTPVSVDVKRFWAWFVPGINTVSIMAQVECVVTVGGHTFEARGEAENICQNTMNYNWQQAYGSAFEDFLKNLEEKMKAAGL